MILSQTFDYHHHEKEPPPITLLLYSSWSYWTSQLIDFFASIKSYNLVLQAKQSMIFERSRGGQPVGDILMNIFDVLSIIPGSSHVYLSGLPKASYFCGMILHFSSHTIFHFESHYLWKGHGSGLSSPQNQFHSNVKQGSHPNHQGGRNTRIHGNRS